MQRENIFTTRDSSAIKQDIRPLSVAIVNLMPKKEETELQLLRMLSNTALQINIDLVRMESYNPNNSDAKRLKSFYKTYDDIKNNKYDAMIITGAHIETLAYEKIKYWEELKTIFEFDKLKEIIGDGAQVYQEDAINPVAKKNITIKILNTNDPDNHGTIIKD